MTLSQKLNFYIMLLHVGDTMLPHNFFQFYKFLNKVGADLNLMHAFKEKGSFVSCHTLYS